MNIKLNTIIVKDPSKASPELSHRFTPDIDYSPAGKEFKNLKEEDKPFVVCRYFTMRDMEKLYSVDSSGKFELSMIGIFEKQVDEVHGFQHPTENREVTVKEICCSQANWLVTQFVNKVAKHLLDASRLTADEEKN